MAVSKIKPKNAYWESRCGKKKIYFTYDKKNEIETPSMNIVTSSSTKYFLTAISEGYYDNPTGSLFHNMPSG